MRMGSLLLLSFLTTKVLHKISLRNSKRRRKTFTIFLNQEGRETYGTLLSNHASFPTFSCNPYAYDVVSMATACLSGRFPFTGFMPPVNNPVTK